MLTLTITFYELSSTSHFTNGRCRLFSPMQAGPSISDWFIILPTWEWVQLLWALTRMPQEIVKVEIVNEKDLYAKF